ncbi:MAG: hypothetical protein NDJ24_08250 [Alphaproteobacteria bacterium]|nr:hypothetical protein [Alphaproteobacteria bacterium]
MKFTVVKIFNHRSFGLAQPHHAVVMDLPETLGGGRRVVDLIPVGDHLDGPQILKGFREAAKFMPFRRTAGGGGEIDFLSRDFQGNVYKQSRAHIPAKPLAGKGFVDSYFDWLCWRARVNLWLQGTTRVDLPAPASACLLEALSPAVKSEQTPVAYKVSADSGAVAKTGHKATRVRGALLTREATPL